MINPPAWRTSHIAAAAINQAGDQAAIIKSRELTVTSISTSQLVIESLYVTIIFRDWFGQEFGTHTVCTAIKVVQKRDSETYSHYFDSCEIMATILPEQKVLAGSSIPTEFNKLPIEQSPFSSQTPVRNWAHLQNIKPWPIEYSLVFVVDRQTSKVSAFLEQPVFKLNFDSNRCLIKCNCSPSWP